MMILPTLHADTSPLHAENLTIHADSSTLHADTLPWGSEDEYSFKLVKLYLYPVVVFLPRGKLNTGDFVHIGKYGIVGRLFLLWRKSNLGPFSIREKLCTVGGLC